MDFDEYQQRALDTAIFPSIAGKSWLYPVMGLAGEAGEVMEKVKKAFRDNHGDIDPEVIKDELGDVLWYLAVTAAEFDIRLSDVAKRNREKLDDRARRGVIQGSGDER